MKKLWEAYLTNTPYFSIGNVVCYGFLYSLLVSGVVVVWKAILFSLAFELLYHLFRGFLKDVFLKEDEEKTNCES